MLPFAICFPARQSLGLASAMRPMKKKRKICGVNVFLQQRLAGSGLRVGTPDHKQRVQDLSAEWRGMAAEFKEVFEAKAALQQQAACQLANSTLSSPLTPDAEPNLKL